jgi:lipopolysaccharide transport system ATP-binding protein
VNDIAITVEELGKQYHIGHVQARYRTLRESITDVFVSPFRKAALLARGHAAAAHSLHESFWALRNVSFEVKRGEVLGVIGRNGAGKSTLLKILSRITEPTEGNARIRGRVSSLLEVGTGFHPELTGRENIVLNGTILGMKQREIRAKFDEIVGFSGVEQFLDTPIKHYSSGMTVRLAFSVAAHLEPEVLIIDEVLAVGDAEFQRKCLGKMRDVSRSGRTVLFVSHNMAAVESLCTECIELAQGSIVKAGSTQEVLQHYRHASFSKSRAPNEDAFHNCRYFRHAEILDDAGLPTPIVPLGGELRLRIDIDAPALVGSPQIGVGIDNVAGERVLTVHTPVSRGSVGALQGKCSVHCRIAPLPLAPGDYVMKFALSEFKRELDIAEPVLPFTVVNGDVFSEGRGFHRGLCVAPSEWWNDHN